jgi:hypothetical protein
LQSSPPQTTGRENASMADVLQNTKKK